MSLNLLPRSTHLLKFSLKRERRYLSSSSSSSSLLPTSTRLSHLSLDSDATARHIAHAVKEEKTPYTSSDEKSDAPNPSKSSSKLVLVIGGSGGVGQLVVASLLSRGIKSRLLLRDPSKAVSLFGKQDENTLEVLKGDTRNPNDLDPAMFKGVTHVICCTGTTAFPSRRWDGDNTPEKIMRALGIL